VGVILGLIYGVFLGGVARFRFHQDISAGILALVVGSAVICSMSLAALMGSLVPMIFRRINIDPAVASGPFISTSIDVVGIFIYLSIATILL
jgi:magnesium transporter